MTQAPSRIERLRGALSHLQSRRFSQAASLLRPLQTAGGEDIETALLLGLALAGAGESEEAARLLQFVAGRRPDAAHPAHDLVGLLPLAQQRQMLPAYFAAALAQAPNDARLLVAAGGWQHGMGRSDLAVSLLERAVATRPQLWAAQVGLAAAQAECGDLAEAEQRLRHVLSKAPGNAAALANLGTILGVEHRFDEAFRCFEQARRLAPAQPQIAINHGIALLKSGALPQGWAAFNRRLNMPGAALLPAQRLLPILAEGQRLDGKTVLVTHDSGFGDTLQFARYVPCLAARGARVLLWVPRPLHRLLKGLPGVTDCFADDRVWPIFDWHCPAIRLAEVFATTLGTIPTGAPYLSADATLVARWAERLPPRTGRRRIGLVWAGSSRESEPQMASVDQRRSINPPHLAPLLKVAGIQWISLQMGRPASGLAIDDPMPDVADFADTAAILASLDAVVSVDTSTVHLAGAMGVPVYLLDRYDNCWRWLSGRTDSPWYPRLRIFRQTRWGDWATPIRDLAGVLSDQPSASP